MNNLLEILTIMGFAIFCKEIMGSIFKFFFPNLWLSYQIRKVIKHCIDNDIPVNIENNKNEKTNH